MAIKANKDRKLTAKQERFCCLVVEGKSLIDSYIEAFKPPTASRPTIRKTCSVLAKEPHIIRRIAELRAPVVEELGITLKSHLQDMLKLRELAVEANQLAAAIAAETTRGKHSGVAAAEKHEHTHAVWIGDLA